MKNMHKLTFHSLIASTCLLALTACAWGEGDKPAADTIPDSERFPLDTTSLQRAGAPALTSYAEQLKDVQEAVVAVYTARLVRVSNNRGVDPFEEMLRRFYGIPTPPQQGDPEQEEPEMRSVPSGQGSGVIVSADGYILTNNHVISDRNGSKADEIFVNLNDGRELKATIVGFDEKTDIAVLKVEAEDLPYANMADSDNLMIGDIVFAIGNPMGVGRTVTMGIISATSRRIGILGDNSYENFIQTDAAINMGNSGGALVDAMGRLIGINTAIVSQSGGSIGIGFAVPVKLARSIMVSLITDGQIRRGMLGVLIDDLSPDLAESFGMDSSQGAVVTQVQDNLPAANAGILPSDIIIKIDNHRIKNAADLRLTVAQYTPETEVQVTLIRNGKELILPVILADQNDPFGTGATTVNELFEGVVTQIANEDLRTQYGIPETINGLVITEIRSASPYARALRPGMVILEINGRPSQTIEDARAALQKGINRLYVMHRGTYGFIAIRM
ncbi:MAG: Do family serine endopeptidase [Opitutales bacterium]|nr:Do family serine endopeptidase [Opitutales bacterium]